jgi:predicted ribosome quality control (RQC) complex YloA/Tae2 family protein
MKIVLDVRKSVDENAQRYFEVAKKARKKAKGAEKILVEWRAKAAVEEKPVEKKLIKKVVRRKKEWFEKFRWCYASDGLLLIGGRDASTNELLIKKHAERGDVVFHTDMAGSPFVVVKSGGAEVSSETLAEAAQLTAIFSRAWKNGLSSLEVFHVAPEQVTKEAQSGEYLGKGAFMIRGKTLYHKPLLEAAVGIDEKGRAVCGPPTAVKQQCGKAVAVLQGNEKTSDVAKRLKELLGGGELDEIIASLPAGGCKLGKSL